MRQRETVRKKCRVLQKIGADKFLIFFSFSSLQVIFQSLLFKNTIQYCFRKSIKETKTLSQIFSRQFRKGTSIHEVGLHIQK